MPTILADNQDLKFNAFSPEVHRALGETLRLLLAARGLCGRPITAVCIGTDRSTGDSLGPLVGSMLISARFPGRVWGTLDQPVHAVNLKDVLEQIKADDSTIIAVDASLGRKTEVGHILVGPGPVLPGAGLRKKLPSVGDFHISGVVNVGGFMDYAVLQCTRLSTVFRMASVITLSLLYVCGAQSDPKTVEDLLITPSVPTNA